MKMTSVCQSTRRCLLSFVLAILLVGANASAGFGQLNAFVGDDHVLMLQGNQINVYALEFQSPSGSLIPSGDSLPFQGVMLQDRTLAIYYNLGTPLFIDGTISMPIRWDATMLNDVMFQYGTGPEQVGLEPIAGHEVFLSQVSDEPVMVEPAGGFLGSELIFAASDLSPDLSRLTATVGPSGLVLNSPTHLSAVGIVAEAQAGQLFVESSDIFPEAIWNHQTATLRSDEPFDWQGELQVPIRWTGQLPGELAVYLETSSGLRMAVNVLAPESISRSWFLVVVLLFLRRRRRSSRVLG